MKTPNPSLIKLPSDPMPHLFPVDSELHASWQLDVSGSTSAASFAPRPRGAGTTPASRAFPSPALSHPSTPPAFSLFLPRMLPGISRLCSPAAARPASRRVIRTPMAARAASRRVIRTPIVARPVSRGRNRTLSPRLRQFGAKPNLALQRTATGCHGSCFSRPGVFPSSRITTRLAAPSAVHLRSYRASPPRSLSLRSLGVVTPLL